MSVRTSSLFAGALALLATFVVPAQPASATSPYLVIPPKAEAEASASYQYAHLTEAQALAELDRRQVPYRRLNKVAGVRTPVRMTAPLHGVSIHGALPADQRAHSLFEVVDARFLLALDDFAQLLEKHDIVEVVHFTMYRPNGPKPGSEEEKLFLEKLRQQAAKARGDVPSPAKRAAKQPTAKQPAAKRSARKSAAAKSPRAKGPAAKSAATKSAAPSKPSKPAHKAAPRKAAPRKAAPRKAAPRKGTRSKGAQPRGADKHSSLDVPLRASHAKSSTISHSSALKAATRRHAAKRPQSKRPQGKKQPPPIHKKLWAPPGTRHPAGLAIDVGYLVKRDGRRLSVAQHFQGHIGAQTCGANLVAPASAEARELRSLVCEARDLGIFTYVLTPNFNRAHQDHFHMEIRSGVHWYLYH